MAGKTVTLAVLVVGVILTVAPIAYIYIVHTTHVETVVNSTWALEGSGGVSYLFSAPSGSSLSLATMSVNGTGSQGYVVIVKSDVGRILLQTGVNGTGAWTLNLGSETSYTIMILNPANQTLGGGAVARIQYEVPLAETPSAATYLVVSIIGALMVGWGAAMSSSRKEAPGGQ